MRKKSDTHRVVAVALPGVPVFELASAIEILGTDRSDITDDWYDFELVASGDAVTIGGGLLAPSGRGLAAFVDADTVIVPACANVHGASPPHVLDALRAAHRRGTRIVSLCSGAFVLAEAGLLSGRRATTHWMHADLLAHRYPDVQVDASALYVEDDGIWTSAGSAAAIDLCLELVHADLGASIANEVARRVVTAPHRNGGQAQFIRSPRRVSSDDADIHSWARAHLDTATVAAMATHGRISHRTLVRRFKSRTNLTPQQWLRRERLTAAQELLESSHLTIEAIARQAGFGSAANLRAQFTRTFGVAPSAFRSTFGATRTPGQDRATHGVA
ncbi:GlxA family transcriptional regulator [Arthrobacter castelli]|uniref:GlxA family transcriptional regulator n=1 Tax=Arthrobacter castelli TaxID=271431 RepID=UPI000683D69E|nr:helix-turn-helix domain-containing protein [Arthrobacter castelli]